MLKIRVSRKWINRGEKIKNTALSLVYPCKCIFCEGILPYGEEGCCRECITPERYLMGSLCLKCGKPVQNPVEEYCSDCERNNHKYKRGYALYNYGMVSDAIYRFKYGKKKQYGIFFGREIAFYLGDKLKALNPDGIVPVPMYRKKEKMRGYNQATVLAKEVSQLLSIPVYEDLIIRTRNTKPLKDLDPVQRRNNLKNAFHIDAIGVKLDSIIIMDDIYTTGSTVDEIAEILMEKGCKNVYVVTLAIGGGI